MIVTQGKHHLKCQEKNVGRIFHIVLLLIINICTFVYTGSHPVNAQSLQVVWSEPVQLSYPKVQAWAPTIIADQAGNVHILWSQTMLEGQPLGEGDTLFYTRWDGKQWTQPIDVLVSPEGATEFPSLAITKDGWLHAVWGTGGINSRLMYAHAPACCADNPQNWSSPVVIGQPVQLTTTLISDNLGRLHTIFASSEDGKIIYLRSDDSGRTWPIYREIPSGTIQRDEYSAYPRLTVDDRGHVHAVWSVMPFPGRAVMYARSDDGGNTWNEPQVIDSPNRPEYAPDFGPIFIDVEAHGEDEIHLIWDGAPTVERNHQWSSDGGNTWSSIQILFPEVTQNGRSGWNDMSFDSNRILHAVSLISVGPPLHASWDGNHWSKSDFTVGSGTASSGAEFLQTAISGGNLLHIVWQKKDRQPFSVWYIRGQLPAPAQELQDLPIIRSTSIPTETIILGTPESPKLPPQLPPQEQGAVNPSKKSPVSNMNLLLGGLMPALLIVVITILVKGRRK